jgi:hypothetical protein
LNLPRAHPINEVIFMPEMLLRSIKMVDGQNRGRKPLPMANYSSAIARAVEWLGDRYLLAKPINAAPRRMSNASAAELTHRA